MVVLGFFAGEGAIWLSRYSLAWFSCDGAGGSINTNFPPLRVVDSYVDRKTKREVQFVWLVYGLGAYNFPIPGRGKLETCIVPEMQTDTTKHNHQSKTKVSLVSFSGLSMFPRLYSALELNAEDYNLDKIKIGWHMTNFKYADLGDLDLEAQMIKQGKYTDMLNQVSNDNFDKYEEVKELFDRMTEKPGWLDRVSSFFGGGNKPQETQ